MSNQSAPGLAASVALVAILVPLTAVSQFYRNAIGVAATTIAKDMTLRPDQLGWLASAFFLTFALSQIPVGIIIDRYGPRKAIGGASLLLVLGAILSYAAPNYPALLAARALLALGCSTFFMGPLVLYSRLYDKSVFSTLTGLQLGLGGLGALVATGPLAYAVEVYGWRLSYLMPGLIAFAFAVLAVVLTGRHPQAGRGSESRETLRETLAGVAQAARMPDVPAMFLLQFATYSVVGVILGLWGGPFLAHVYGVDLAGQGKGMTLVAVALVAAILVLGPSDRLMKSYKRPVLAGVGVAVLSLFALAAFAPQMSMAQALTAMALIAAGLGVSPVFTAHGRALFPPHLTGRGLTFINVGVMGGAFTMQTATGLLIRFVAGDAAVYPLHAYRLVFLVEGVLLAAALLFYTTTRDPLRDN